MSTDALVDAIYCGPFVAELPDGSKLKPGDQHKVPASHLSSGHWRHPETSKAKKGDA